MINKAQKSKIDVIEELNSMKIENMNCLDGMKKIPNNSIDMVCTDPPYLLNGLDEDWNTSLLE